MRAQVLKEVVLGGHPIKLHQLADSTGKQFLRWRCWCHIGGFGNKTRTHRRRQCLAVRLVGCGHRYNRQIFEVTRHHIRRQISAKNIGYVFARHVLGAWFQAVVGDKFNGAWLWLIGIDDGLGNLGQLHEN